MLRHFDLCPAESENLAKCVLEVFHDLLNAYETCRLDSYSYEANLLDGMVKEWRYIVTNPCRRMIKTLCNVTEEDTWFTYIHKLQTVATDIVEKETNNNPNDKWEQDLYDDFRYAKLTSLVDPEFIQPFG